MMIFSLLLFCFAGIACGIEYSSDDQDDKLKSTVAVLKGFGIDPTLEGVKSYLTSLIPTDESIAQTKQLIELLSHPKFEMREKATQELMLLPSVDEKLAKNKLLSADPETAYRIGAVLEFRSSGLADLQRAVFDYVIDVEIKGLAADIMQVQERIIDASARRKALKALEVSARPDDFLLLQQKFVDNPNTRDLATTCLRALSKLDAVSTVNVILEQNNASLDDFVALEAAKILAQNKNSDCLDYYVSLLDSDERLCRSRAFIQLKMMTDQEFEYSVTADGKLLQDSIQKWQQFVTDSKDEIEIQLHTRSRLGRLLVCNYSTGDIYSYDESGELRWSANGSNAFTCQGLPNGNCLVMLYSQGKLREYDENGKLLKEFSGLPSSASGIQRLENGNTILACGQSGNKIIEIDEDGKQIWSTTISGTPTGAMLQENGLILVSLFSTQKIVEIDRKGEIRNEFKVNGQAYTVNVTSNDTLLVAFADGGVAEYTRSGKEIWRAATSSNTYWAQQLEDGSVVTADTTGVLKLDASGKVTSRNTKFKDYTYVSSY